MKAFSTFLLLMAVCSIAAIRFEMTHDRTTDTLKIPHHNMTVLDPSQFTLQITNGDASLELMRNGEIYANGKLVVTDTALVNCLYKLCEN
jgi:hypothetical protein